MSLDTLFLSEPKKYLPILFKMQTQPNYIKFNRVTKRFNVQKDRTFKELIPTLLKGGSWAAKITVFSNLSFEIKQGETVGIIGKNGAGKSTVMKLIAGVTYPTKGKVAVRGKVAPLIELSAGFHHELNGHENIFLNAAILGMHKKEIEQVYDKIIEFSELEEFLLTPIKRYSSGMLMRLAFAIAVHSPASILLIDEVLAVGDQKFQIKCLHKLTELKNQGDKIIVFVSHSQGAVTSFCDRAILLHQGECLFDGSPSQAFKLYRSKVGIKEDENTDLIEI